MRVSEGYRKKLIADWQHAYEAYNGTPAPSVRYENGYFLIDNAGRIRKTRRAALEQMRDVLRKHLAAKIAS
jgi:hypothetical protein